MQQHDQDVTRPPENAVAIDYAALLVDSLAHGLTHSLKRSPAGRRRPLVGSPHLVRRAVLVVPLEVVAPCDSMTMRPVFPSVGLHDDLSTERIRRKAPGARRCRAVTESDSGVGLG